MKRILVTGGAGFIGTHLCRALFDRDWEVTAFDSLSPQIHGLEPRPDLPRGVQFVKGSVCDHWEFSRALEGQDVVVHLAAETGTGQSMYELTRYQSVNVGGVAVLMHEISQQKTKTITKVVVASSRAVYGEGAYRCSVDGIVYPRARRSVDMASGSFECRCPVCNRFCEPVPTEETCPFGPNSFYGVTKQAQEQTVLMVAESLGISAYALRYQNVYGPGQSLLNPYTGILAVFTNLARAEKPISVFEDGQESRDFVFVDDAVQATLMCIERPVNAVDRFNVGSGERVTVERVAREIVAYFGNKSPITISGQFRSGDIRHNFADLSYVERTLGYRPMWRFNDGLAKFLAWAEQHELADNGFSQSLDELKSRGLLMNISLK
jgi:dTDP-L-rhamnose 4-epimerase